jgi:hypothetical protein
MTKTGVLASRIGGDHVSYFDIALCDNHPVDKQLDKLAFLFERGVCQAGLDALTETLH